VAASVKSLLSKLGTPLAMAFFLAIATTGLMLFFKLGAATVKELHQWVGISFVVCALLHVVRNRKPFAGYIRTPAFWMIAALAMGMSAAFVVPALSRSAGEPGGPGVNALMTCAQKARLPELAGVPGNGRRGAARAAADAGPRGRQRSGVGGRPSEGGGEEPAHGARRGAQGAAVRLPAAHLGGPPQASLSLPNRSPESASYRRY
jgi:hypothetical protein